MIKFSQFSVQTKSAPAIKFAPVTSTSSNGPDEALGTESDVKSRIPAGAEATSVLVGTVEELDRQVVGFIRLSQGCLLRNLLEVSIPVRFIFIVLGPPACDNYETGRSLATLMSDKVSLDKRLFDLRLKVFSHNHTPANKEMF